MQVLIVNSNCANLDMHSKKKIALIQVSQYANPHYTRTYIVPSPPYHQKVIMRPKLFMAQKCVKNAAATLGHLTKYLYCVPIVVVVTEKVPSIE